MVWRDSDSYCGLADKHGEARRQEAVLGVDLDALLEEELL